MKWYRNPKILSSIIFGLLIALIWLRIRLLRH